MGDTGSSGISCLDVGTLFHCALRFREEGAVGVVTPLRVREEEDCFGVLSDRGAEGSGHDQKKVPFIRN